jgi:hypothetical protein
MPRKQYPLLVHGVGFSQKKRNAILAFPFRFLTVETRINSGFLIESVTKWRFFSHKNTRILGSARPQAKLMSVRQCFFKAESHSGRNPRHDIGASIEPGQARPPPPHTMAAAGHCMAITPSHLKQSWLGWNIFYEMQTLAGHGTDFGASGKTKAAAGQHDGKRAAAPRMS